MLLLSCLPSLLHVFHMKYIKESVENIQSKFQKGTYQWKCGLLSYKSVKYGSSYHPRFLNDFDCNPSKVELISCSPLLYVHSFVDGKLYISSTWCPYSPKVYFKRHWEIWYLFLRWCSLVSQSEITPFQRTRLLHIFP
jgi:hypothetical protein